MSSRSREAPGTSDGGHRDPIALDPDAVRALVDTAPDGILMTDEAGTILFANRQAEALFGFDRDDLLGRTVDELLPERLRAAHRAHRTRFRAEPRLRPMGVGLLLFGRRRDGTEFPVEISLSPLSTNEGLHVIATVRDVSERVQTAARQREVQEALDRAEQHLRIVEDRERIARDLHDVVIQKLFAAGMVVQSVAARSLDTEHARRLNGVVDDLDDTIREIRSVIFSLQSDVRRAVGLRADVLRIVDQERGALGFEPHVRFSGPVDTTPHAVASELLPALREALSNVARHAGASSVDVDVELGDGVLTLVVRDNGRGLPEAVAGGNGLRNLSQRAAKLGGHCTVVSRQDHGSELEWQVPA
jgi:PAS domain S-box-containing protein